MDDHSVVVPHFANGVAYASEQDRVEGMGVDVPGGQLDVIIALHDVHVELPF